MPTWQLCGRLRRSCASGSLALSISGVEWRPEIFDESAEITGITDTFHAMGGCRMGTDPRESVVDSPDCARHPEPVHCERCRFSIGWKLETSFTIIALALRLGDQLAARLGRLQNGA